MRQVVNVYLPETPDFLHNWDELGQTACVAGETTPTGRTMNTQRSSESRRVIGVLTTIQRLRGLSDGRLADRCGVSRQFVQQRRSGRTAIDFDDVSMFAEALDVPPTVFYMDRSELHQWLADNSGVEIPGNQEVWGRELVPA